nr:prolyl oligopeptidase family serine peptidase [Halosimplex litoreum]
MEKYLGTPEESPELYEERLPVTHVETVDSPLSPLHGVNDRRVPVSQARIVREALEDARYEAGEGGDFEYEELGEGGHASSDQAQKLRPFRLFDEFLDRRVGAPAEDEAGDSIPAVVADGRPRNRRILPLWGARVTKPRLRLYCVGA